jgi:glycosyltransferase involved in cell wall biosynthesis
MKDKIKLIFFHPYSAVGGADNSLYKLIKNLDKKIYSCLFVSIGKSFLRKKLKNVGFINLKKQRALFNILPLRKIIKKISSQNKYSKIILVSNQNFANIIAYISLFFLKKIKIIFIERNHIDELFYFKNISLFLKNIIIFFFMKLIYPRADKVVAISYGLKNILEKHTKRKVDLIYNPAYDKEIFQLAKKNILHNFENKKKYIISVSRFTKRKGIEDIVEAFYLCQKKLKFIRLILIGYGDRELYIKKIIKNKKLSNKINIIKNCNNPYPYIKKSDLFILNSKYEGFANVLVESIMLDTPVISTNCNSGPSEILLKGKGGVLVPVNNNIKYLSKEIFRHFSNQTKLNNKNKIAKTKLYRFDLNTNVNKFHRLFLKV